MSENYPDIRASFLKGAKGLCERVTAGSPRARIVFYQTWARHADYWKAKTDGPNLGKNPLEMQSWIRKWYREAASASRGSVIAPIGDAWQITYRDTDFPRLHAKDNSHPTFSGSYLAGLVLYSTLHPGAKLDVPFHGNLPAPDAARLQGIAAEAVRQAR